jgi:hypothetical protein
MMKKQLLYVGMLLMAVGFTSCNEDFKNWADPQSNSQLDPTSQYTATFQAGTDADVKMDTKKDGDSLEIAKYVSTTAETGSTVKFGKMTINGSYTLPYAVQNNSFKVAASQLDSLAQLANKSRASVAREMTINIASSAITPENEGFQLVGNDVKVKLQPAATPAVDANGYYIVGDFKGWNAGGAIKMTQSSTDPTVFELETEAPKDGTYFKIFPASAVSSSLDWSAELGSQIDGDDSGDNFIVWKKAQAIKVDKAGKIKITIDMTNYRFTVKDNSAPTELYMTGSAYNWGVASSDWRALVPVNGVKGAFWGMYYFSAGDAVKFAPQAAWKNDFGYTGTTFSQASIDRAGLTNSEGNIKVGKAGWYLIYVSVIGNDRTVEFEAPTVYLTGDCADGGWSTQFGDATKFTVPTDKDGSFVSPAFVKDGEIRICVVPSAVGAGNWWKSEFIVLDGKITYRGNGGDQTRVTGKTGQKVTLNFSTGVGSIQ